MELHQSNNINYLSSGQGTPLYLIHGFPDCAENFKHQINFFAERGFKVIVPYLPGYHENDEELDTYQTLRIAEVLIDFIESVNFEEVTREADNSLPNIDFIDHFNLDNIEIVLDQKLVHNRT